MASARLLPGNTQRRPIIGGLLVGLVMAGAVWYGVLEALELGAYDRLFDVRRPRRPTTPIVIVTVGEESFSELNHPWPFPRALHAQLLNRISVGKPAVIGVGIVFPEPSPFGPAD